MIHALMNHLWQSTVFAVAAGLLTLLLRKNGPHTRYLLWFVASCKFLIPFSLLSDLGSHFALAFGSRRASTFDVGAACPTVQYHDDGGRATCGVGGLGTPCGCRSSADLDCSLGVWHDRGWSLLDGAMAAPSQSGSRQRAGVAGRSDSREIVANAHRTGRGGPFPARVAAAGRNFRAPDSPAAPYNCDARNVPRATPRQSDRRDPHAGGSAVLVSPAGLVAGPANDCGTRRRLR